MANGWRGTGTDWLMVQPGPDPMYPIRNVISPLHTLREDVCRTDQCLVMLSPKTYVFEDRMTRYWSASCFFLCIRVL